MESLPLEGFKGGGTWGHGSGISWACPSKLFPTLSAAVSGMELWQEGMWWNWAVLTAHHHILRLFPLFLPSLVTSARCPPRPGGSTCTGSPPWPRAPTLASTGATGPTSPRPPLLAHVWTGTTGSTPRGRAGAPRGFWSPDFVMGVKAGTANPHQSSTFLSNP